MRAAILQVWGWILGAIVAIAAVVFLIWPGYLWGHALWGPWGNSQPQAVQADPVQALAVQVSRLGDRIDAVATAQAKPTATSVPPTVTPTQTPTPTAATARSAITPTVVPSGGVTMTSPLTPTVSMPGQLPPPPPGWVYVLGPNGLTMLAPMGSPSGGQQPIPVHAQAVPPSGPVAITAAGGPAGQQPSQAVTATVGVTTTVPVGVAQIPLGGSPTGSASVAQCSVVNDYGLIGKEELSSGTLLQVEWYTPGQPERESLLPIGRYPIANRSVNGHAWEYSQSCSVEQVLAEIKGHIARRLAFRANNAGYVHWTQLTQSGILGIVAQLQPVPVITDKLP